MAMVQNFEVMLGQTLKYSVQNYVILSVDIEYLRKLLITDTR
jgi:Na+-translocating ferredoxin:NAD+ oxidoreductase RnfA subunit